MAGGSVCGGDLAGGRCCRRSISTCANIILQAPKEFYQAGRITFLPHNVYANMPLGTEMLSLLGMVVAGDWWTGALVGKTLIACFAPLTALALLAAGRRFVSAHRRHHRGDRVHFDPLDRAGLDARGWSKAALAFYLLASLCRAIVGIATLDRGPSRLRSTAGAGRVSGRRRRVLQISGGGLLPVPFRCGLWPIACAGGPGS